MKDVNKYLNLIKNCNSFLSKEQMRTMYLILIKKNKKTKVNPEYFFSK